MKKINNIFGIKVILVSLFIFVSVFVFSGIALGQVTLPAEICNAKDDNGNGLIDENINCDHYLSYLLDKSINPISIVLSDQFIKPTDFKLVSIERLLNPVKKIHDGISFNPKNPNLHYLAYRFQSAASFVPRTVLIQNQFETRNITAVKPLYLLTPSGKKKTGIPIERILSTVPPFMADKLIASIVPPVPQNVNHYLCYDVEPYDLGTGVFLTDQFQTRQFEVIRPRYLCNPAEKTHDGKVYKIADEKNHLMCYEVIPHNPVNRPVIANDQFGIKSLKAVQTEEICLPTIKTLLSTGCIQPDENGTAVVFDLNTKYHNLGDPLTIVQPTLTGGAGLTADVSFHSNPPDTIITRIGSPSAGETYTYETEMLQLSITGGGRVLNLPISGEIHTSPRTPGDPVQSFDTDMLRLQGQLTGDPDFDLLRVTAGSGFGLPSPGHTTLTKLPDGGFQVDSFFDITYRIDFVGAPGGPFAGRSDSITGTLRLEDTCPQTEQNPIFN